MANKKKVRRFYVLHDIIWAIASFFGYFWFRPKKVYVNEKAKQKVKCGALLISNHLGFFDPIYVMMSVNYRRHHFIATTELFSNPIKRFLFEQVFLCIEINRKNVGGATLKEIFDTINRGQLVSIFPEGEINRGGTDDVAGFKSGVALIALKCNCPIVPIYIHKRKTIFNRLVTVIGEPIVVSDKERSGSVMDQINELTERLQKTEEELRLFYKSKTKRKE